MNTALALALSILISVLSSQEAKPFQTLPDPPKPDSNGIYRVGNGVSVPTLISSSEPDFPEDARKNRIGQHTMFQIVIEANGSVDHIHVIHSAADRAPSSLRALALIVDDRIGNALRQYWYKPALLQGHPVPVMVNIELNFDFF